MITYARLHERIVKQAHQRIVSIVLIVGGAVLLVIGIRGIGSFNTQVSRVITGSADRATWLMLGGVAAIIAGASVSYASSRKSSE